jgi:hypothetical protein
MKNRQQLYKTAEQAAATATAAIQHANELKGKLTDIQNQKSQATDAQIQTETDIKDDELKRNVEALLTAVQTAQSQVVEHFKTEEDEATKKTNDVANEAQNASKDAIIALGKAIKGKAEINKDFPIQMSIKYLKQVAEYCKKRPCKANVLGIIKQISDTFNCQPQSKESVRAICEIAKDLANILIIQQQQPNSSNGSNSAATAATAATEPKFELGTTPKLVQEQETRRRRGRGQ